ncbi:MAG: hypothetical protein HGA31_05065 [Candidatus Moranbacteria bacterium]|nr:hypothetical protein [Candidatus Moranbacteria bacterium]
MTQTITRIKKTDTSVPSTIEEIGALLNELGMSQDDINQIERDLQEKVRRLKEKALRQSKPSTILRDRKMNSLFMFAEPRKDELTEYRRSVVLGQGKFGWRKTPPSVATDKSDEKIIAYLKKTGNERFIRTKEELDRRALLAEKPEIPGVSYVQREEFFVVPNRVSRFSKTFTHAIDR